MKFIKCLYEVIDCEHDGDIAAARSEVIDAVNKVCGNINSNIKTFWDGEDGGDAYVMFEIPENKFVDVREELGDIFITK